MKIKNVLPSGIYGILSRELSLGRTNIEVARAMIEGGIRVIQYRDKDTLTKNEQLRECREIRKMTSDAGVLFLINDFVDIALLIDADGVHLGQDDIPLDDARSLLGNKIIGLSTHSPQQALTAQKLGADYIGVGPIYHTTTKIHPDGPVGLEYLDYVVNHVQLSFVAIGGIKKDNLTEVLKRGAQSICLVTAITQSPDIANEVRLLNRIIEENLS